MDEQRDNHSNPQGLVEIRHGRWSTAAWHPVTRGVQRKADADDAFLADLQSWQTILRPAAAFTHLTSARLRGWWLPPGPPWLPVFVCMSGAQNAPRRPGLDVTRRIVPPDSERLHGLLVATPAETILACADDLGVIDLVVLIDSAMHLGVVTIEELEVLARRHRRGAPRLRQALRYVDGRSESAWETLLRLLHVAGDVPVEPQHELFDADGLFVARGDLWIVGTTTFHEYDGAHHLTKEQQRIDLRRARRIGDVGWLRRGYTSEDVLHQAQSVLRDADLALGRPHDPARGRGWHDLMRESRFTGAGKARLRKKLQIPFGN
jgi:hypothetical protein